MTGSATERPYVHMDSIPAVAAGPPAPTGSATEQPGTALNYSPAAPADPTDQSASRRLSRAEMDRRSRSRDPIPAVSTGPPAPTGSAAEQSDIDMNSSLDAPADPTDSSGPAHAMIPGMLPSATQLKWEILVSFNNDMWWAMPHELSDPILEQWNRGAQQVSFIWDWKTLRKGSYQPDGEETSISRYIINFDTMSQRNLDSRRVRRVKVVGTLR